VPLKLILQRKEAADIYQWIFSKISSFPFLVLKPLLRLEMALVSHAHWATVPVDDKNSPQQCGCLQHYVWKTNCN